MARHSSIANRWFFRCFSVMVIVLVLVDLALYYIFRTYFYNAVRQTITSEVNTVSTVLTRYYGGTSANLYSNEIRSTIENFGKKDRMELMMINSGGNVIMTSSGFAPSVVYSMPDYNNALQSENGTGTYYGRQPNGENVMAVTNLLDIKDSSYKAVRIIVSLSQVDTQIGRIMLLTVFVSMAVIVIMLLFGLYFIRSIVKPLRQITANAQKIAHGDFFVSIEEKSDDELGELCRCFNHMAQELRNSENIKNDFISSVSHELRTPLTAIKGWSETVASNPGDFETAEKGMNVISEETERLSDMVEDLLDFSRMQSGRFNLRKENTDLFAELTDVVIMYSERAKREGKTLVYDEQEELVTVYADKGRIRQVFVNIIDNAIKYSDENGRIEISTLTDNGQVTVTVRDNGCGIAEKDLPKVKSKFFKANNSVRGSGIGLAVADEIVAAHGGTLEITSKLGEYTCVEITLPLDRKDPDYEDGLTVNGISDT